MIEKPYVLQYVPGTALLRRVSLDGFGALCVAQHILDYFLP